MQILIFFVGLKQNNTRGRSSLNFVFKNLHVKKSLLIFYKFKH